MRIEARWSRRVGVAVVALAASCNSLTAQPYPQNYPPQQSYPGAPASQNPVCTRLEGQLSLINRGGGDPARADQARRYEDSLARQQADLDRVVAQARRTGCENNSLFSFFTSQPPECRGINAQLQNLRASVSQTQAELQRLQGGNDVEGQRQAVVAALAQNNCGPQYQAAANQQRGLFGGLFGSNPAITPQDGLQSSGYRTLCVRTCDGYYFPVSFQTSPSRFADDEQACQRMCPAAEVQLFTHRNPGEEVAQSVSLAGRSYRDLPTAFKYRQSVDAACSCRKPGQSWAEALGVNKDTTVERGDIVVTEERSKAMSQPQTDAQGRPLRLDRRRTEAAATAPAPAPAAAPTDLAPDSTTPRAPIRAVGPTYTPAAPR